MAVLDHPAKRAKLLSDDEGSSSSDSENDGQNGVSLPTGQANSFKINEEYAKRFEHNKKREDRQRLEEKFKSTKGDKRKRDADDDGDGDDDDDGSESAESSEDETEDDDAELATAQLDQEIMATLQAIKSKDPRVYDKNVKFYEAFDPSASGPDGAAKKDKPMYLQDYHRENLLAGHTGAEEQVDEERPAKTYQEEQDALKRALVGSMHAAASDDDDSEGASSDRDGFLVTKTKPTHEDLPAASKPRQITDEDIAAAERDPETYLSNFMAARAWLPTEDSRFQALDSDDSDEEKRAEEFEEAYNMRFEDPKNANEKLQSFARDVGKHSARREEKSARKKAREREQERKEHAKREREEERARLRRLKIEEAEEKLNRIKKAAGLKGQDVDLEQWQDIIEGDFDDDQWDQEMKRRFGDQYYAEDSVDDSDDEVMEAGKKKRKAKKPKWDDDIDITDLVPDFEEDGDKPDIALSTEDEADGGAPLPQQNGADDDESTEELAGKKRKTKKDRQQEKAEAKRAARKQRRQIEEMIDRSLPLDNLSLATSASSKAPVTGFRYRETSPTSFGLSARDILFAEDGQLNQYAGLKKMAAFRDADKKKRDKKKFSKKARLRQWRKETFGQTEEPSGGFERFFKGAPFADGKEAAAESNVREGERKKKRRNKKTKAYDSTA